jgi:hypothetical protein
VENMVFAYDFFYEDEEEAKETDFLKEDKIEELLDEDEISAEEAAFLQGYELE